MWEKYHSPTSITEVLELLAQYKARARIIAGGTDILIELERGQRPGVTALIDVSRVPDLDQIALISDHISLGPLVTHNAVVHSDIIIRRGLPLAQACWEVGAPQIRNRATVAGNLVTASPANDTITPLIALGAEVTLSSLAGERTLPLTAFYRGLRQTVMRPDEMLTRIVFPAFAENERGVFLKLGLRQAQAISVVNVAVVLAFEGEKVVQASIALGSVAPTIIRVTAAEQSLIGKSLTKDSISEAARLAAAAPSPIDDVRGTAVYRTEMIKVLTARALRLLQAKTQAANFPPSPAMLWGENKVSRLSESQIHERGGSIETTINGKQVHVKTGYDKTLLRFLREDLRLPGTKEGCAEGECGACTVFMDGAAVMACMVAAPRAHGAEIVTIEGLAQNGVLHPIQRAFIEKGAVQCGYCTPGFLMAGAKLLDEHPQPTREQIQQSISGNLCRCTGYYKIVEAFIEASKAQRKQEAL